MSTKEAFQELQFLKDILNILKDGSKNYLNIYFPEYVVNKRNYIYVGETEKDIQERKKKTMSKQKKKYT